MDDRDDIQRLKSDRSILKKTLLKERDEYKKLERRLEEMELDFRKKAAEAESLELANSQLEAKCQALQEQAKGTTQGWSLWKSRPSDEVLKLQKGLAAIQEDLRAKIEENGTHYSEIVHTKNFEQREHFKHRKNALKLRITEMDTEIERLTTEKTSLESTITELRKIEEELNKSLKNAKEVIEGKIREVKRKSEELQRANERRELEVKKLMGKIRTQVSLDDTGLESLTSHDASVYSHLQLVPFT